MKQLFKSFNLDPYIIAETIVTELYNLYEVIEFYLYKFFGKYKFLKKNRNLKNIFANKRIFLIGNSPAINNFDLTVLSDEIVIMLNRSFKHPDYVNIKPKYHIIVDSKLYTGEWPLSYLDEIFNKNPNVKLILNANWYHSEKFEKFKKNKNIFWIKTKPVSFLYDNFKNNLSSIFSSGGVAEQGLSLALYLGFKKIYMLGVEHNGVIYMLNDKDSHFNGRDSDYNNYKLLDWSLAMNKNSRALRNFHRIYKLCKKKDIQLINLTKGGFLNFLPNDEFNNLFNNNK